MNHTKLQIEHQLNKKWSEVKEISMFFDNILDIKDKICVNKETVHPVCHEFISLAENQIIPICYEIIILEIQRASFPERVRMTVSKQEVTVGDDYVMKEGIVQYIENMEAISDDLEALNVSIEEAEMYDDKDEILRSQEKIEKKVKKGRKLIEEAIVENKNIFIYCSQHRNDIRRHSSKEEEQSFIQMMDLMSLAMVNAMLEMKIEEELVLTMKLGD